MINYGITFFGGQAIIKLRIKLSDKQHNELSRHFPAMDMWKSGVYTMINGILTNAQLQDFVDAKKIAMLRSKIEFLYEELRQEQDNQCIAML
jgi:hypothetical protein